MVKVFYSVNAKLDVTLFAAHVKKAIYFAIVAAIIALVVKINADLFHKPYVLFVVL